MLVVSLVVFSPEYVLAKKCKKKFYTISLKDSYLKKKYKVRAFFFGGGSNIISKIPSGWHYSVDEESIDDLIAAAYTDKDAVGIDYFKDFLTFVLIPGEKLYITMKLIYLKPNGTSEIMVLHAKDFVIKDTHKCLKSN
ncbi:MAG: hypothetical protein H7843_04775 [Nitrospirota bacterium]